MARRLRFAPNALKDCMHSLPKPKPGIMEIHPYVAGKSRTRAGSDKVIKLSSNESPLGPSPKAIKAYQACAKQLHRYPDSGCAPLREAIGEMYKLDPARIVC